MASADFSQFVVTTDCMTHHPLGIRWNFYELIGSFTIRLEFSSYCGFFSSFAIRM